MRIAVIPARSGSKGLADKNILELCGKPVLAWSVEAALKSSLFDKVIVSTDSEKYGEIAESFGAEVMFRGPELSSSSATTFMVLKDLLGRLNESLDWFMLLQPTSPLRDSNHIRDAADLFESRRCEGFHFLASVKESEHSRSLITPIDDRGSLAGLNLDYSSYRRQDAVEYTPNGAIFIAEPERYLEQGHFFGPFSLAYVMSQFDSVDIDGPLDFELAKLCMERRLSNA